MNREKLLNAFLPASGVEDPHRFAGRRGEVSQLADALLTNGSVPLIYGHRGLGKSSLALQLSRIAQGDVELLEELNLGHLALAEEKRFLSLYVNCSDSTKNIDGMLQLMINAVGSMRYQKVQEDGRDEQVLVDKTTRRKLSLKLYSSETTRKYDTARKELDTRKFSREELLIALAEALTDVYGQPVLFILDEVDRVKSTKGLSSFLKSYSSEFVKFALVGIGTTEGDLLRDHASLNRQLVPVRVPTMSDDELQSIVDRTMAFLADNGLQFKYTDAAKQELARVAAGYPWFVHLLGQETLVTAVDAGESTVSKTGVEAAIVGLPRHRFAKQFNDLYRTAVKDSAPREIVLRLFAEWRGEAAPTSVVYPRAHTLNVSNPSTYVGHLTQEKGGQVLARAATQGSAYRFTDEMFKTYARMRGSLFADVDEDVRAISDEE